MEWRPIETAPDGVIVDVLFDPIDTEHPEFYCPSGKITGVWRLCHMYRERGKWWASDGLDAMQKRAHDVFGPKLTHWMPLPVPPARPKQEDVR